MNTLITSTKLVVAIAAVLAMALLACEGEDPEDPQAPAAARAAAPAAPAEYPSDAPVPEAPSQVQQQPAQAAPARGPQLPEPAALPAASVAAVSAPTERQAPDQSMAMAEYEYMPMMPGPGEYFSYKWDGPIPTKFKEPPMLAQMVREGSIPPIEQRLPVAEDVQIIPPPDEIGEYGGTWRITTSGFSGLYYGGRGLCMARDADGVQWLGEACKSMSISEDGRVYTVYLRRGMKWNDGDDLTSEDFRFAWQDLNWGGYENLGYPFASWAKDPVTGNEVEFGGIDDFSFTLSFDSPNFVFHENKSSIRNSRVCWFWCWYAPEHYLKQFHVKYADSNELKAKIDADDEVSTWQELFGKMANGEGTNPNSQVPGLGFPTVNPLYLAERTSDIRHYIRNPYSAAADPEGNQLPYVDYMTEFKTESREVAVFRSMGGETDAYTNIFRLAEVPLYIANMERGDYSLYWWTDPCGCDATIALNQTFNKDPEIGRWLRTQDFRRALSLGMDRNAMNQTVFLGLGQAGNWVPHSSVPWYPGDEYLTLDAVQDLPRANKILDDLGIVDTDGDGIRNRKGDIDGDTGNFELFMEVNASYATVAEVWQSQLLELGIKLDWEEVRNPQTAVIAGDAYFELNFHPEKANPWDGRPELTPTRRNNMLGPEIGKYVETNGEEGMAPGPDSTYLPMAPPDNYAADPSGNLRAMYEMWLEGTQLPPWWQVVDPRRVELGKEMYRISSEEKYYVNIVGLTGNLRGIMLKRNNFRNVPKTHVPDLHGLSLEAYYFEDGLDNLSHPGNRSRRYASENLIGTR